MWDLQRDRRWSAGALEIALAMLNSTADAWSALRTVRSARSTEVAVAIHRHHRPGVRIADYLHPILIAEVDAASVATDLLPSHPEEQRAPIVDGLPVGKRQTNVLRREPPGTHLVSRMRAQRVATVDGRPLRTLNCPPRSCVGHGIRNAYLKVSIAARLAASHSYTMLLGRRRGAGSDERGIEFTARRTVQAAKMAQASRLRWAPSGTPITQADATSSPNIEKPTPAGARVGESWSYRGYSPQVACRVQVPLS